MSLCPHLLPQYFQKVRDVLVTFQSQISEILFSEISSRLVARNVITEEDYYKVLQLNSNCLQMEQLINIISNRIRAFECFIMVLMEENCHPWLAEEMYNAYLRHVVGHIKQLKNSKKCDCPQNTEWEPLANTVAIVKDKLSYVAGKVDQCLYSVGTSIGFMDQSLYPKKNMLESINKNLPFLKDKKWKSFGPQEEPQALSIATITSQDKSEQLEPESVKRIVLQIKDKDESQILEDNKHLHATSTQMTDSIFQNIPPVSSVDQDQGIPENEFDVTTKPEADTQNPDIPFNLGLSDLEWDNYDLIENENCIQNQTTNTEKVISQSNSTDLNDLSDVVLNDLTDSNQKSPAANNPPLKKLSGVPRKVQNGKKNVLQNQKNVSPSTELQRCKPSTKKPSSAFNTTSKSRLSPTDYVSIQKSIEWCNKHQN